MTAPVLTALVLALGFGAYHYWTKPVKAMTTAPAFAGGRTADMEDLWRPFASLQPVHEGIRDMQAQLNQPQLYVDHYSTAPAEEGVAYALVTHLPGPMGGNDVESFTSSRAAGYVAAVKAFTDPKFVQIGGRAKGICRRADAAVLPGTAQVKFKDEVPTEIGYVLARELR